MTTRGAPLTFLQPFNHLRDFNKTQETQIFTSIITRRGLTVAKSKCCVHRKENKGALCPREAGTSLAASGAHRGCSPARVPQQLSPPVTDRASRGVTVQNKAAPADQGVPSPGLCCLKPVNYTAGEQQTKNPHHTNNQHRTSFYRALAPPGSPALSKVRHLNPADSTGSHRTVWGL